MSSRVRKITYFTAAKRKKRQGLEIKERNLKGDAHHSCFHEGLDWEAVIQGHVASEKRAYRFLEKDDFGPLHVNDGLLSVREMDSWSAIN